MSVMMLSLILLLIICGVIGLVVFAGAKGQRKGSAALWITGTVFCLLLLVFLGFGFMQTVTLSSLPGAEIGPRAVISHSGALRFFVILFIIIILVIFLLSRSGQGGRRFLGVGALILLLVLSVLGGIYLMAPKRTIPGFLRDFESHYENQVARSISETPAIWFAGMEDEFEADIYPSQRAAVRGLGHRLKEIMQPYLTAGSTEQTIVQMVQDEYSWRLLRNLRENLLEKIDARRWGDQVDELVRIVQKSLDRRNEPITIKLVQQGNKRPLLEELRRSIRDKMEVRRCLIVSDMDEVDIAAGEIGIRLNFDIDLEAPAPNGVEINYLTSGARGTVEAVVLSQEDEYPVSVEFAEKPWVENFADFLNRDSRRRWLLARSPETCSTAEKAHELGLQDAAQRISYILNGWAEDRSGGQELIKVKPDDIRNEFFVVDKFPQSFRGSAGPIWREALLLDVSAPKLDLLSRKYAHAQAAQRRGAAYMVFSFMGMMGLICLLYAVVNAATKGYYTTVLRVMTAVLAIAVLAGLFVFFRTMIVDREDVITENNKEIRLST